MIKAILTVLFLAGPAQAGVPYWMAPQASTTTAYGTGYLSGALKVYPSTSTAAAAPAIYLDGVNQQLTVRNGANVSTITGAGFYGGSATLTGNVSGARFQISGSTVLASVASDSSLLLGKYAGINMTAAFNTAVGVNALNLATTGEGNTAVGAETSGWYTTQRYNTAVGYQALHLPDSGEFNTAVGAGAGYGTLGYPLPSFSSSTLVGFNSGFALTTGSQNTMLGFKSGYTTTTGSNNILIGANINAPAASSSNYMSLGDLIVGDLGGSSATVRGNLYANNYYGSGANLTGIIQSSATGTYPLSISGSAATATDSTKVAKAGDTMTGQLTTASTLTVQGSAFSVAGSTFSISGGIISMAGGPVATAGDLVVDPGAKTVKVGRQSGTTGDHSVFIVNDRTNATVFRVDPLNDYTKVLGGHFKTDYEATIGSSLTVVGAGEFRGGINLYAGIPIISTPTDTYSLCMGRSACNPAATGLYNTVMGSTAGNIITIGSNNVLVGRYAGGDGQTTKSSSVVVGMLAGYGANDGGSVLVGYEAGRGTSGDGVTYLGYQAGYGIAGSNNIYIGKNAGMNFGTKNNTLVVHNSSTTAPLIYGDMANYKLGIATGNPQGALDVNGVIYSTGIIVTGGAAVALRVSTSATGEPVLLADTASNNRVGIGTSNLYEKLNVASTSVGGLTYPIAVTNPGGSNDGTGVGIAFKPYDETDTYIAAAIETKRKSAGNYSLGIKGWSGAALTEYVTVANGGYVGIGTTAPQTKLHLSSGTIFIDGNGTTDINTRNQGWAYGAARGVYATNYSGATLSSGTVVMQHTSYALGITTAAANTEAPVGTVYDATCANGASCRVCTEGICYAKLENASACANSNDLVVTGDEDGRAECKSGTAAEHNQEIGQPASFTSATGGDVISIWAHRN